MSNTTAAWPSRLWNGFWRLLTSLRRGFFNLLFLLFLALVLAAWIGGRSEPLPDTAPLHLTLEGVLVDQLTSADPLQSLMGAAEPHNETDVAQVVRVIDAAATDPRINALVLQLDYMADSGSSKIAEVAEALKRFKAQQKPIIAYADYYTQQQYFLAAHANEIYVNDMGGIMLTGYGLYRNYFKDAADKLLVNVHIFKVGTFKDFVEPYTRNDMSEASRQHNNEWLQELWSFYVQRVETQRALESGSLDRFIRSLSEGLAEHKNDPAQLALAYKLVDKVVSRVALNKAFVERFGADEEDSNRFRQVSFTRYWQELSAQDNPMEPGNIGLIVASGTILDGEQPEGRIGGDSLSALLRKAREDKDIKALVVRIDSGGGSAFASELIRQEMQAVRDAGKPVLVSMGSVAASGGYWMAMAADQVWATPVTITGSIGVFGLFPSLEKTLEKLGVHTDGIATHTTAGAFRPDRALDPTVAKIAQQTVEGTYQRFLTLVAQARKKQTEDVDALAQGRVWTGSRAQALGLVDHLGYLNDVVAAAAQLAQIESPKIKPIERELSPKDKIIRDLLKQAQLPSLLADSNWLRTLNQWENFLPATALLPGSAPQGFLLQATCLECKAL
jgi:protease IV